MKKRILSLIASIVFILVAVIGLQNKKVVEAADDMVLLEKRHPGYWNYLSPDKMIEVQTIPGFEEVSTEEIKAGNVLKDFYQGNYGGVDISCHDGKMNFKGTATKYIWPGVADLSNLATGTYFISIGAHYPSNAKVYFEGFKDGKNQIIAYLDQPAFIYLDTSQYDEFKFTVCIGGDVYVDFSINPVIYKLSDTDITSEVKTVAVWENVPTRLLSDDKIIFHRRVEKCSSYFSVLVLYQDGSSEAF